MSHVRTNHSNDSHYSGAVVKAEELGPYPDSAWPDAGQKMSCLNTIMVAAEVMTGTLRDHNRLLVPPHSVRPSKEEVPSLNSPAHCSLQLKNACR